MAGLGLGALLPGESGPLPIRILNGRPRSSVCLSLRGVCPLPLGQGEVGRGHVAQRMSPGPQQSYVVSVCEDVVGPGILVAAPGLGPVQCAPLECFPRLSEWPVQPRSSQVNFWHSDQCNMINGTSGQMWAPFMNPESSLEFYSPEACR